MVFLLTSVGFAIEMPSLFLQHSFLGQTSNFLINIQFLFLFVVVVVVSRQGFSVALESVLELTLVD